MVSGILWIPDLQKFMLHFNKIINFSFNNQVHKTSLGYNEPHRKRPELLSVRCFYCLELAIITGQCYEFLLV